MYYTGEQLDQYEENFERDEEDIQINDDEEVQSLIERESEALAAVSQANRTSAASKVSSVVRTGKVNSICQNTPW